MKSNFRNRLHEVIFEADTKAGKLFDIVLIITIIFSVIAVMLDSVKSINDEYGDLLFIAEWVFTILFTVEYLLRIYCVNKSFNYIKSFYGVIDLLAIIPTYVSFFFPGTQYLLVIRILRVLRVFRVLKFVQYLNAANHLKEALVNSKKKIIVFLFTVAVSVVILGSIMYLVEGAEGGFTSIPKGVYWAVVTLTTVGYGDISPQTGLGQTIAAFIMILGYGIIAVPTGIVTSEVVKMESKKLNTQVCQNCNKTGHTTDALYCKYCGTEL